MAGTKMSELRSVPPAELRQRAEQLQRDMGAIRLKGAQGHLEQPHRIRLMRRDVARIFTVLSEVRA